ncbi:MAG: ABC transporter permease [Chloroflexi bacterium]|nr:MAG: ABC transporter permease [Chloroflexota bacterium]
MVSLSAFRELYDYRELLYVWSLRDLKARYKQSLFGFAWAIFQPLALTAVFVVAFSYFIRLPSDGLPYPIFVFAAMLPWSFFARSLNTGITSIVLNMHLVTKIYFPRAIFPLTNIVTGFADFLMGLVVFIGLMFYYQVPLNPAMLTLPLLFVVQLLLMAGLALGASALNVFYRDIGQMTPLLLQIWMYACPIIYPLSIIPDWIRPFYMLNPMAVIIHSYRQVILQGQAPNWGEVGLAAVISAAVFVGGYLIFKRLEDQFADII